MFQMQGMLDSGSMACTFSGEAEERMLSEKVLSGPRPMTQEVVLVGCGGKLTKPKCMYEVELKVYGLSCIIPVLVVPGQRDDFIIGTNVIKFLMRQLKNSDDYWRLISVCSLSSSPECEQFLDLMANTSRWRGEELPDKIGTVKLKQSVTLLAMQEHLVWGKLPNNAPMRWDAGSSWIPPGRAQERAACSASATPARRPWIRVSAAFSGVEVATALRVTGQRRQTGEHRLDVQVDRTCENVRTKISVKRQDAEAAAVPVTGAMLATHGKPGSTVLVEPTSSKSMPRNIMVGRVMTPLWGDSLKHIAGTKNIVADALSRDPFAKTAGRRLVSESYNDLLAESDGVGEDGVQNVFRLKVQYQAIGTKRGTATQSRCPPPLCDNIVEAVLDSHNHWDAAAESRATGLIQSVQHFLPPGQDLLPAFSLEELQRNQALDPGISMVMPFLNRQRRPSRRERDGLDSSAMVLIRQWERLKVIDGVLYRVAKDSMSKQKRHQFVLPRSLVEKALRGVHDLAGHQGQARTIHLARQRFWPGMERQIKGYVKCC
ncbi:hypothetical protein N1851_021907 [Merluccius polli]|uniref:Gypsy retrotransposon integrase-like protein 1 n=1 Tax=Merluccius polli TaxID=89951 RepID=A0AA47MJ65_MERPO|nr:hypothetical protein N1851_021907 [Merluccius polli]